MNRLNKTPARASVSGCAIAMAIASGALCAPAFAADAPPPSDSGQLQEIVVTAQHRSENLRQVPIAVTAVSGDALQTGGVPDTSTLVEVAPSVNFTRSGPAGIFVIRGVGTPNGGAGEEGSTAVYVDDVYMPDLPSTVNTFNNIERVEVLNGPQGTLFGRNATAGAIHIITKDPGTETAFKGQIGYGNYDTVSGQAYFTTPLSDKLGWDIAFTGQNQGKGFGYDSTLNTDVRATDYWGLRSKLVFKPGSGLKVTLGGDYYVSDDTTSVYLFPVVNRTPPQSSQNSPANYPSFTRPRSGGVSAKIEGDLGFANLTSITSWRKLALRSAFDVDGSALDLFHLSYYSTSEAFQQEVRLASKGSEPLSWQLGAFYMHGISTMDQTQGGAALRGATIHIVAHGVTDSISGFGEATYALTPTTHLTGGVRWTSDHRNITGSHSDTLFGSTVLASATPTVPTATFDQVTYRAALRQDITQEINAYVSVNKGFKSGEFNLQSPGDAPVKPETIMAYEAGLKSDLFDRHLHLNLSAYHYDISNYQIRTTIGTHSELANAASVKVNGIDITAEAALTRQLHLTAGATWLRSWFSQFGDGVTNIAPTPGGIATGYDTALAPHFTLDAGATYTVPIGNDGELRFTGNITHKSSYYFEVNPVLQQREYNVGNLSVEYDINKNFGIELWMKNVGNKNYNVEMLTAVGQGALSAPPQTYGANLKVKF